MIRKLLTAALIGLFIGAQAHAANIPLQTGPLEPNQALANENALIGVINGAVQSSTTNVALPKNVLDNSNFALVQRGITTTQTCGTTTIPETAYSADRWGCNVNVSSGAGTLETVTTSPTPLAGELNSEILYRTSGSLTQPQCMMQEVPQSKVAGLNGQTVDFSVYLQALGGLQADNGSQANLYVWTGTTADQGLQSFTSTTTSASVTVATTGIITYTNTLVAGQQVYFTAATMPTGLTTNQYYYVSPTGLTTSVFSVSLTPGGPIIAPSSAGTTVVVNIPAITPAFTGLALLGQSSPTFLNPPVTLTTSWNRYSTGPLAVPAGVNEIAVAVCFTPTVAVSGGTTDGIAVGNAQLEALGPNQTTPSAYENKDPSLELNTAQQYYRRIVEPATGVAIGMQGTMLTTTTCALNYQFAPAMRVAPTFSNTGTLSTSTWKIVVAADTSTLASTFLVSPAAANSIYAGALVGTLTTASTAGWACQLQGQGGTSSLIWGADF